MKRQFAVTIRMVRHVYERSKVAVWAEDEADAEDQATDNACMEDGNQPDDIEVVDSHLMGDE